MGAVTAAVVAGAATVGSAAMQNKAQRKATKAQQEQKEASQEYIERQQKQARQDIFKLYPSAQESRQRGIESAVDVLGQTFQPQMNYFQGGNLGAQQMLSQGLPQVQNAYLGAPIDYSQLQPMALNRQPMNLPRMPQFQSINEVMQPPANPQQNQGIADPNQMANLMRMWSGR